MGSKITQEHLNFHIVFCTNYREQYNQYLVCFRTKTQAEIFLTRNKAKENILPLTIWNNTDPKIITKGIHYMNTKIEIDKLEAEIKELEKKLKELEAPDETTTN